MGGSDDPSNLIELSVEEHAEAHRVLYENYKKWEDYIAWKTLSGQISMSEAKLLVQQEGRRKGGLNCKGRKYSEDVRKRFMKSKSEQGKMNMRVPKPNNTGSKNGRSTPIEYNGVLYNTMKECSEKTGKSLWQLYDHKLKTNQYIRKVNTRKRIYE